ncbi:MAG: GerMN domain-containing protein [Actinobacteria bacterium]|nr:GerMN domain-containing protein [Actinomycetota bacterium]
MPCGKRAEMNFLSWISQRVKTLTASLLAILFLGSSIILGSCSGKIPVTLYFAKQDPDNIYLVTEVRSIPEPDNLYKAVVEELVKGPGDDNLYPTLPSNVRVISVTISGETAIVDFSREIITNFKEIPHSSTTETLAIYSIVNTLTEMEEIKKVRITVEGLESGEIEGIRVEDFWGHMGIYEEFFRNEEIIGE